MILGTCVGSREAEFFPFLVALAVGSTVCDGSSRRGVFPTLSVSVGMVSCMSLKICLRCDYARVESYLNKARVVEAEPLGAPGSVQWEGHCVDASAADSVKEISMDIPPRTWSQPMSLPADYHGPLFHRPRKSCRRRCSTGRSNRGQSASLTSRIELGRVLHHVM